MEIQMQNEPEFDTVLEKVFDGQELTDDEKIVLDIFNKIFGNCKPISINEYISLELGDETQYLEFLERFKADCYEKSLMISGSYFHGMFGNERMSGAVILFDAYHSVYPNMMLLILKHQGDTEVENELMGKQEKNKYFQENMSFIRKENILGLNLSRHCCPRPNCEGCSKNRDNPDAIPYTVEVMTKSGEYPTIEGNLSNVMPMVENIQLWLQSSNKSKSNIALKVEYWLRKIKDIFVKEKPSA